MSVAALNGNGFHLSPRDCFPPMPPALRGNESISFESAIPPLWSLRFFADYKNRKGAPDGSRRSGAADRQRLDAMIRGALVLCLVLGVAAERLANRRTQVKPVEVINRLLAYEGEDRIPTLNGALSVSATGARLRRALTVSPILCVTERPVHIAGILYFVPDDVLDSTNPLREDASFALNSPRPRTASAVPNERGAGHGV